MTTEQINRRIGQLEVEVAVSRWAIENLRDAEQLRSLRVVLNSFAATPLPATDENETIGVPCTCNDCHANYGLDAETLASTDRILNSCAAIDGRDLEAKQIVEVVANAHGV